MEISSEVINKEHTPRNSKELYLSLLGVDRLPANPEDMPKIVFLPKPSFGNLEDAILQSHKDETERSQSITWDSKLGYKKSPIFLGTHYNSGDKDTESLIKSFFGAKPICYWHTHFRNLWEPSAKDIASTKSFSRKSYIELIGSELGVVALFQTKQTEKIPLSSIWEHDKTLDHLRKIGFDQMTNYRDIARMVNELGFAFYFWAPSSGKRVEEGSLNAGMHLWKTIV